MLHYVHVRQCLAPIQEASFRRRCSPNPAEGLRKAFARASQGVRILLKGFVGDFIRKLPRGFPRAYEPTQFASPLGG